VTLAALHDALSQLEDRVQQLEEEFDTIAKTPWWTRLWFGINGWPWYRLTDHPQWRPWHRWTGW
jgi:hypothetical protein